MKKRKGLLLLIVLAVLILVFSACDGTVTVTVDVYTSNISGKAVNAQATGDSTQWWIAGTESLEGAVIDFYAEAAGGGYASTESYTTNLDSSGAFSIDDVTPGRYKITGTKTDWTFVPRYVDIAGEDMELPDLIAYRSVADEVLIILSWEDTGIDVDGVLSYATDESGNRAFISPQSETDHSASYDPYFNLDRAVDATAAESVPRVETISIAGHPFPGTYWYDTEVSPLNIPDEQLRYYVTVTGTAILTGLDSGDDSENAAFAQVDVMYNNEHFGVWTLPYNTYETTLHVVTIDAISDGSFTIYSAGNANYGLRGISANSAVSVDDIR